MKSERYPSSPLTSLAIPPPPPPPPPTLPIIPHSYFFFPPLINLTSSFYHPTSSPFTHTSLPALTTNSDLIPLSEKLVCLYCPCETADLQDHSSPPSPRKTPMCSLTSSFLSSHSFCVIDHTAPFKLNSCHLLYSPTITRYTLVQSYLKLQPYLIS